ncbi:MAG: hypothetical protein DRP79_00885, partial [Planctomycetota bacterium]
GLFGLALGSFLNVVIYRLPRKCDSIFRGRSFCPQCAKQIAWYDNIPLLSYILLGGRCRHCGARISPRYFLVELLTGGLFAYLAHRFLLDDTAAGLFDEKWPLFLIYGGLTAALIACTFIDIRLRIIPDEIDKPFIVIGPVVSFFYPLLHKDTVENFIWRRQLADWPMAENFMGFFSSIFGVAVGAGIIILVGLFGKALFRKEAMGFGDVKFLAMIGGFLGWDMTLLAFLLACFTGALIGVVVMIVTKDHYMPFGPNLALGAVAVILFRDVINRGIESYMQMLRGDSLAALWKAVAWMMPCYSS